MLTAQIDEENGIALIEPNGALSKEDFISVANVVDPWIEKHGELNGLIIHTRSFPGWDSFAALSTHFVFVKEHHAQIARVAFVTDSKIGNFAEKMAKHFVSAEIKLFPYQDLEQARLWVNAASLAGVDSQ